MRRSKGWMWLVGVLLLAALAVAVTVQATKTEEARKAGETRRAQEAREALRLGEARLIQAEMPEELKKAGLEWVWSEVAGLYFTKAEVTVAQYRACVEAGVCDPKYHNTNNDNYHCNWGYSARENHPMNCVSWHGAKQFCEWVGGRLPTEHEWYAEASNGGTWEYPWGNEAPTCRQCIMDGAYMKGLWGERDGCGEDRTWEVCSRPAGNSVSGLCDMSGNVWEWTSTKWKSNNDWHVVRGGAWNVAHPLNLRALARHWLALGWYPNVGIRCVRDSQ